MPIRTSRKALFWLAAFFLAGGCSQQPARAPLPTAPTSVDFTQHNDAGTINGQPPSPDAIVSTDPAASRLQDIGGFLLLYYNEYKRMPQSLDELAKTPGGDSLNLTAPRSGREFTYQPTGLWSEAHPDKCIVAYDPDLRGSMRWCLFLTPPTTGAALTANVIAIPEQDFNKYKPAAQ